MKNHVHALLVLALFISCFMLSSCSGSEPETANDKAFKLLSSGTWQVSEVNFDNVDETNSFSGLTLTFKKGSYTSSNGGAVWESSGLWEFTDNSATAFIRDDDAVVTITTLSQSNLKLTMHWDKTIFEGGGRTSSIAGEYVFVFHR